MNGRIIDLLQFSGRRRLPFVRQNEASECALACLAMIAGYYGFETDLNTLRRRHSVSLKGANLKQLIAIAARLDLACRPLRAELEALPHLATPAILHWDMNHFVVLKEVRGRTAVIHDPAHGVRRMTLDEISPHFTGVALEVMPAPGFRPRKEKAKLRLTDLWTRAHGLAGAIVQVLVLSALLQIFALVAPFYMQLVVDEVLVKFDADFLLVLAIGFGLLVLIHTGTQALRGTVILYAANQLGFQMVANLFRHTLRLPLSWFEKRHIGDIVSRFSSTGPIRDLFTQGLVSAVVDGVMAVATLILIFVYSWKLGLVVLAALGLYLLLRLGLYRAFRQRNEEQIVAAAKEQTNFMESVRAIQSIKLFAREAEREAVWQNRYAERINAGIRVGRLNIGFEAANTLLFGLENVLVIYLGARAVMAGELTVGMLFAFMSYKQNFIDKAVKLVERLIEFRLLDLHLERIADIALAEPEPAGGDAVRSLTGVWPVAGALALENVSFRYAEGEPWVLKDVTLEIAPGEHVVFIGPSGGGKTTLVKIMAGLFQPSAGRGLVDGIALTTFGLAAYRSQIGAVMQEDALLSGSIADNISFFDPEADLARIEECARLAQVHDEIAAMPMGYDSLIGDMGTVLSGGQKQRVLLARALYRRPRILILDEGTANLDPDTERRVLDMLDSLSITRISVAHRETLLARADRVFLVGGGRVVEVPVKEARARVAAAGRPAPLGGLAPR